MIIGFRRGSRSGFHFVKGFPDNLRAFDKVFGKGRVLAAFARFKEHVQSGWVQRAFDSHGLLLDV